MILFFCLIVLVQCFFFGDAQALHNAKSFVTLLHFMVSMVIYVCVCMHVYVCTSLHWDFSYTIQLIISPVVVLFLWPVSMYDLHVARSCPVRVDITHVISSLFDLAQPYREHVHYRQFHAMQTVDVLGTHFTNMAYIISQFKVCGFSKRLAS